MQEGEIGAAVRGYHQGGIPWAPSCAMLCVGFAAAAGVGATKNKHPQKKRRRRPNPHSRRAPGITGNSAVSGPNSGPQKTKAWSPPSCRRTPAGRRMGTELKARADCWKAAFRRRRDTARQVEWCWAGRSSEREVGYGIAPPQAKGPRSRNGSALCALACPGPGQGVPLTTWTQLRASFGQHQLTKITLSSWKS